MHNSGKNEKDGMVTDVRPYVKISSRIAVLSQ